MTRHTQAEREAMAITGIVVVSPLGSSFAAIADALVGGRSGLREIDAGDPARGPRLDLVLGIGVEQLKGRELDYLSRG